MAASPIVRRRAALIPGVIRGLALAAGCAALPGPAAEPPDPRRVAEQIRIEATRPADDPEGLPLPLACSWTCGNFRPDTSAGWRPENQIRLIEAGHHILPWFAHPHAAAGTEPDDFDLRYFKQPLERARELGLPLAFIGSQWESGLSAKPFLDLPADENPNVVTPEGVVLPKVSPFGPVEPWREVGRGQTDNPLMGQIQEWYPDPPRVFFVSNNEHGKLAWPEVETDRRYLDRFGKGRDDDFKRTVVADGWIERYRGLQAGLRAGLANEVWRDRSTCIGYDAFGPTFLGRWPGWPAYSLFRRGRIDPSPLTWDGGSPSYYTDDWQPRRDWKVWSPQIEFMNLVFMKREAERLNPQFWFEFSVWDGYQYGSPKSTRAEMRRAGQVYGPERYAGSAQFGIWLLRPRAVRDFRGWIEPWDDVAGADAAETREGGGPYFMALVGAVDRVHDHPVLRRFWRNGRLVPNRAHQHPYQSGIPVEYAEEDRWFLLDTPLDPPRPWNLGTELPVFSLALVRGTAPAREWLVYAHAPLGDRRGVGVTIPDHGQIEIDVPVGGAFYRVDERGGLPERL